jgi:hypothetical protein
VPTVGYATTIDLLEGSTEIPEELRAKLSLPNELFVVDGIAKGVLCGNRVTVLIGCSVSQYLPYIIEFSASPS